MKIIKNKSKGIDPKALIVTADCSKGKHVGYFRSPDWEDVKPFKFDNTKPGFELFWQKVENFRQSKNLERIIFGYESTGNYSICLAAYMLKRGAIVYQVNPKHSNRLKELQGNSPNTTDQKDPRVIADILMLNHGLTFLMPKGKIADLRHMVHNRERIQEDIIRVKNRIEALLAIMFPEYPIIMRGLRSKTSLYFLRHYPTPADILTLGLEKLTEQMMNVSMKRLGKSRAQALYSAAEHTIGVTEGVSGMRKMMNMLTEQSELLEHQLVSIENQIRPLAEQIPVHRILTSIRGIGLITSVIIITEIVDFGAYQSASEVIKLAGLDLFEISSGKHKGKLRISKRGRSLLRKALYFASLNMVGKNGIFYQQYQRYRVKGNPGPKALTAIGKKLLRVIFAMVKNNTLYQPDYKQLQIAA